MPIDLHFTLVLIVRMAVTAGFVLLATVAAERVGPLIGGLVATLPLGGGPVYVFYAIDHGPEFIATSALNSLAINNANLIFALVYALLGQKRSLTLSLSVDLLLWFVLAWLVHVIHWTILSAIVSNIVVFAVCYMLARPLRYVRMPRLRTYWYDLALRALLVALLVGVTVTLSFHIGAAASGIFAVFPVILISIILILHRRVGGPPTAAVMANAVLGLVGFALACIVLHYTAVPFGSAIGLSLALATSIAWSLVVIAARRCGIAL